MQNQLNDLIYEIAKIAISGNTQSLLDYLAEMVFTGVVAKLLGGIVNAVLKLAANGKWERLDKLVDDLYAVQGELGDFLTWERKHSGATLGLDMFAFEDERGGDVSLVLAMYWGGKVQRGYALDNSLYYELVKQIHECRTSAASDTCREGPHSDQPSPEEPR